jgi:tetratricopeptide (TPR) repeat protein
VTSLEQAGTPAQLDAAIKAVGSVAPLDGCEDVERLLKAEPRLELPAERAAHAALLVEMKEINAEIKAKRYAGLAQRADELLARARKLDQPWTTAAALETRCRVAGNATDYTAARACWTELTEVAARAGDDESAARAWQHLAIDVAGHDGRFDEAKVMVAAARAVVARAGDPPVMRQNVLTTQAQVLTDAKEFAAARPLLDEARRLLIAEGADQAGSPLAPQLADLNRTVGHLEWLSGNLDAAVASWQTAIAQLDRALGPDTMYSSTIYTELAQVLHIQQKEDEADAAIARVVRIREHAGNEPGLASALGLQAQIMSRRRPAEAIAISERALAIARRAWPETSTARLGVASMHALNLMRAQRKEEALALYEEVVAIAERERLVTTNAVIWSTTRAQLVHQLGDTCAAALPLYKRSLELATAARADGHYHATALRGEGLCLHALGRDVEAIDRFERSLAVPNSPGREAYETDVSFIRAKLGTLLYDTGRDRARGLTLARTGLAELHKAGEDGDDIDKLDAWFKRRRLSPDGK